MLDSTCYDEERKEYYKILASIRNLRVVEFIGRFRPIEEKIARLDELNRQFVELQATLGRLLKCCQAYQELAKNETQAVRKVEIENEEPFALKIKKDLKEMETAWVQLFIEGSLRRLHDVLSIAGLEEHEVNLEYGIQSWIVMAEGCFVPPQKKLGCCLRVTTCLT